MRVITNGEAAMGAWATGNFDNDTACDWAYDLEDTEDLTLVSQTLARVTETGEEYLDADVASEALAACEVVARLQGKWGPRDAYTEPADKWVETHPMKVPKQLADQAQSVIERILRSPSELLELWEESDDGSEWRKVLADLKTRVQG
jgi:hypothetical protein